MKPQVMIGVLLVLLGCAVLAIGHFSYTTEKQVVAVGPLTASVAEQHNIALPNIAGFGLIVVGGLVVLLTRRNG
jgi:uncharacterized membrane protein